MSRRCLGSAVLMLVTAWVPAVFAEGPAPDSATLIQRIVQGGLALELTIAPAGGARELIARSDAMVRIRLVDERSGQPLTGYRPQAWIAPRRAEAVAGEAACADKIRGLARGLPGPAAVVDLNAYLLLTINNDKTISVINPQVSFNTTKLENLIVLPANGADWALSNGGTFLYVSIPGADAVAIVDTVARRVTATLPTGDHSAPGKVALQPGGRYIWVALDGSAQAVAIDTTTNMIVRRVDIGHGLHGIAFGAGTAAFTNSTDDTVSIVDLAAMRGTVDVKVGQTPVALAYVSAGGLLYVGALNSGTIAAVDLDSRKVVAEIPAKRGIVALGAEPSGRYVLAVNQLDSAVAVIDSATNRVITQVAVVEEPDQVVFSQRYAYVRGLNSEKFTLLDLAQLLKGTAAPVNIQAGRQAPATMPNEIGVAAMVAPSPDGTSAMIANGPDATIYYYQEGMMAPSGTFSNYKRVPRGLLVLDRSLTEVAPGEFAATVRLAAGGKLEIPVWIDQPRMAACFQIEVRDEPASNAPTRTPAISVSPLFGENDIAAGIRTTLGFRLHDSRMADPIVFGRDLGVTVFKVPGTWQRRAMARSRGDGVYDLTLTFPDSGQYNVVFSIGLPGRAHAPPYSTIIVHPGLPDSPGTGGHPDR
jgi:YVTN family beta-propeller protein